MVKQTIDGGERPLMTIRQTGIRDDDGGRAVAVLFDLMMMMVCLFLKLLMK